MTPIAAALVTAVPADTRPAARDGIRRRALDPDLETAATATAAAAAEGTTSTHQACICSTTRIRTRPGMGTVDRDEITTILAETAVGIGIGVEIEIGGVAGGTGRPIKIGTQGGEPVGMTRARGGPGKEETGFETGAAIILEVAIGAETETETETETGITGHAARVETAASATKAGALSPVATCRRLVSSSARFPTLSSCRLSLSLSWYFSGYIRRFVAEPTAQRASAREFLER